MSGVRIAALFERLMEIHSTPPKLYYGFKGNIEYLQNSMRHILPLLN